MKQKISSLFLLTLILSILAVSAASFTATQPAVLSKSVNLTSFRITNPSVNETLSVNIPAFGEIDDGSGHQVALSQSDTGSITIANNSFKDINISYSSTADFSDFALGTFSKLITLTSGNETRDVTLNFISGFCEFGELKVKNSDGTRAFEIISVRDKTSENDWEWRPLDIVEIDVKVKFNSGDNDDNIDGIIKIGLYDIEENEFIDLDSDEDTERDISLDEGETVTETFKINVPVEDLKTSTSRYKLYVKVYEDGNEEELCADSFDSKFFQNIEIKRESYMVVLDNIKFPTEIPCGEDAEVTARVYNTGTRDEDKVLVSLYNKELGIDLKSDVGALDAEDSEKAAFNFKIPEGAAEKKYSVRLSASYKYSKSTETYREESEDYGFEIKVEGNCKQEIQNAQINAKLDSSTPEAVAGKQVIIDSALRNTGNVKTTYTLSISGNTAWSDLVSVEPQSVTLEPGESKDVSITLSLDKEAEGDKEFSIKAVYNSKTTEQKVALSIAKTPAETTTQFDLAKHLKDNWFIYVIILVNLILIIAIIIVVRRMVARPVKER